MSVQILTVTASVGSCGQLLQRLRLPPTTMQSRLANNRVHGTGLVPAPEGHGSCDYGETEDRTTANGEIYTQQPSIPQ
jgi:hypothetical protein